MYALHPGAVASDLDRALTSCLARAFFSIYKMVVKTPFNGAQTSLYCTLDDRIASHTGRYYSDCREKPAHRCAMNIDEHQRLWKLSREMTGMGPEENEGPDTHSVKVW